MARISSVPFLKTRDADSHKGDFGRALIVGGSRGMTGAVVLAGMAASRSGAGLLTLAVPDRCLETVAAFDANYMTLPVPDDDKGRMTFGAETCLLEFATNTTSVGIGPGLSRCPAITDIVLKLYELYDGPMVVDADALNALATCSPGLPTPPAPRILTPHIGEFRRLVGQSLSVTECREHVGQFARQNNVIVVLKGSRTLVTDGADEYQNTTGNPGMATGGSGDVLTGVVTTLSGQKYSPMEAAILGVHVHGLAGDIARDKYGDTSLVAENICDCLSQAFQQLQQ